MWYIESKDTYIDHEDTLLLKTTLTKLLNKFIHQNSEPAYFSFHQRILGHKKTPDQKKGYFFCSCSLRVQPIHAYILLQ